MSCGKRWAEPWEAGSTASSLAIIRVSHRDSPTVLCPLSSAAPAGSPPLPAGMELCGTASCPWYPRQPWGEGLRHPSSETCQLSAKLPNPFTPPPNPWGPPPASLSSSPLSSHWVHPSSHFFRQPVLQVTTNIFCSLRKQVAEKDSDVNYLTLSQKQKIRKTDKGDPLNWIILFVQAQCSLRSSRQ